MLFVVHDGSGENFIRGKKEGGAGEVSGRKQDVTANIADLGRNVVDDDHLTLLLDCMDDRPRFVFARASLNRALHGWLLLSRGVIHFGDLGSYTVIKISSGCAVVQTMWSGRPAFVNP